MELGPGAEHFGKDYVELEFGDRDLEGMTFELCSFTQCDFKGHSLAKTRLLGCSFRSCDLSNVTLANARVREISFEECKLLGIQWVGLGDLIHPSFKGCILNYGNFLGLKLKKTTFHKCLLRDCDFSQADLSECDLREADLLNAKFHGTSLLKADLRHALNYLIDPIGNKVRGARFTLPEAQGLLAGLGVILET